MGGCRSPALRIDISQGKSSGRSAISLSAPAASRARAAAPPVGGVPDSAPPGGLLATHTGVGTGFAIYVPQRSETDILTPSSRTPAMNGDNKHFEPQADEQPAPVVSEEVMVADVRAGLTPAQMVERKLVSLLKAT